MGCKTYNDDLKEGDICVSYWYYFLCICTDVEVEGQRSIEKLDVIEVILLVQKIIMVCYM